MTIVNQIYQTSDYSLFKPLFGNRFINKAHVSRLKVSFKNVYLMSPLLVNAQMEIIDGQHRFEAAKELNLPIYFMICNDYGLKEVQVLNTNMSNWKKMEYLKSYCDLKVPVYLQFRNFMRKYPMFGLSACEVLLIDRHNGKQTRLDGENNRQKYFEECQLQIPDYDKSCQTADRILQVKPYFKHYNKTLFVRTMHSLLKNKDFVFETFISKLDLQRTALQPCATIEQYKFLIEDIYNYRNRDKVSLRYN